MRTELTRAIERAINDITEAEDKCFEDNVSYRADDYACCFEDADGEIIKNFVSNYTSRKIGFSDYDDLDGQDVVDLLQKAGLKTKAIVDLIMEASEAEPSDYYIQWNEVASVQIGEMEYQIDLDDAPELFDLLKSATPEELAEVRIKQRDVDSGSMLVYGNPCDRIIWKVDPEVILERLMELVGPESTESEAK